jgi:hypothetical protein
VAPLDERPQLPPPQEVVVADPTKPDDQSETIRRAPEDGDPSTQPRNPPADEDRMKRSAESGEGEVPDPESEEEQHEKELPSNRAQERGGP